MKGKRLSKPIGVPSKFVGKILKALHNNNLRRISLGDIKISFNSPIKGSRFSSTRMFFTNGHTDVYLELDDFVGVYVKGDALFFVRRIRWKKNSVNIITWKRFEEEQWKNTCILGDILVVTVEKS